MTGREPLATSDGLHPLSPLNYIPQKENWPTLFEVDTVKLLYEFGFVRRVRKASVCKVMLTFAYL